MQPVYKEGDRIVGRALSWYFGIALLLGALRGNLTETLVIGGALVAAFQITGRISPGHFATRFIAAAALQTLAVLVLYKTLPIGEMHPLFLCRFRDPGCLSGLAMFAAGIAATGFAIHFDWSRSVGYASPRNDKGCGVLRSTPNCRRHVLLVSPLDAASNSVCLD